MLLLFVFFSLKFFSVVLFFFILFSYTILPILLLLFLRYEDIPDQSPEPAKHDVMIKLFSGFKVSIEEIAILIMSKEFYIFVLLCVRYWQH